MSKLTTGVFVLLGLISACVGQNQDDGVLQYGQCNQLLQAVQDFDLNRYLGVWYDIESLPASYQQGTCNTAKYSLGVNNSVNIRNSHVVDGMLGTATGTATLSPTAAGSAKLDVTIGNITSPYWVLATDYENFALVYSCQNESTTQRRVSSWKLSRQRFLSNEAVTQINQKISEVEALLRVTYIKRDHTLGGCTFAEAGQCPSVSGTSAFNPRDFLGVWYESARYPQANQAGQCNRANYTAGANGAVTVENSQVIDETLFTISGQAVVLLDRPGVLQVSLNVAGGVNSQILVVLATDNIYYALLYSCEQLTANTRRVGTWQLRKSLQSLSAEHNTVIQNAINANSNLIDSAYYYQTSQSPADCFHYPVLNPQQVTTIELPGLCDQTITGYANFNPEAFQGTWYEVARYPQSTQTGQCNQANYYALVNGVINVRNSQVVDGQLRIILGIATTIPGRPGVLAVTLATGNGPVAQDLYVLDTDHTTYALLYSCRNIALPNGEFKRAVGSWKLSKQQGGLSSQAEQNINHKISIIEGLDQTYYLNTSQTNDACLYYPEINPQQVTRIELPGSCNNITGYADFNAEKFVGTWYEVARYPQPTQTGQCNQANYTLGANGVVNVRNSEVVDEDLKIILGTASTIPGRPGVLAVTLETGNGLVTQDLYVLDTDHVSYALLYSCRNITGADGQPKREVGSWKLSKQQGGLTRQAETFINETIRTTPGLNQNYYLSTSQNNAACFYYPEINPQQVTRIELPGSCNNITGYADFSAEKFVGTWYEVARYPQPTQTGQCNQANYTLGANGVVNVRNSEVVDEDLKIILGTATTIPGRPGVLAVTLETGNGLVTQNLYVLDTDHTTYALLYSCRNITLPNGEFKRVVGSWKLSKQQRGLSSQAEQNINQKISTIEGLNQTYYLNTSQTNDACFYYPEINPQQVTRIELPGSCNNVTGYADFNAEKFVGTWHEVARYPQPTQTGQCNQANYTLGANGVVNVRNSEVVDEDLKIILGTATTIPGRPGVLAVTLETGNGLVTQDLYVLDTDHVSYALLYSCRNITGADGQPKREVGSWKLSKQQGGLTRQAETFINETIRTTPGLNQNYYLSTSQNNAACFYYPEINPQQVTRIELPGSCNNVTGYADFNAEKFVGTWYEVARYPQPTQTGQCNQANYTLGANGVVNVRNSEVVDEDLKIILGTATTIPGRPGVLAVTLETGNGLVTQNLYVLDTDHTTYALLYSCRNITLPTGEFKRAVGSWKLSKQQRGLSSQAEQNINKKISTIEGLNQTYYLNTSQTNDACFYYPEINPQQVTRIELPGSCNNITGYADFNAEKFVGTWYEVARYPQPTQTGQCNQANYTLGANGVVNVRNSQVVDEDLKIILGTATTTADRPGVLAVTLETGNGLVTQDLYVLDTDHVSYALLYSCRNITGADGQPKREVGSWKLSKQQGGLTRQAETFVNETIRTTPGLNQNYYLSTSQNNAACFYYPEINPQQVTRIELPGSCNNITGYADFSAEKFVGTWYEVARYPQPTQTGQCNQANYTLGANGVVNVRNSQVVDEDLKIILGTATTIPGRPGVLAVTLETGNGLVTQNLYVLDTDYTTYALLYSCRNITLPNGEFKRAVGSWKLSKQQGGLSSQAEQNINKKISIIEGLNQTYYLNTSQTNDACFYYPEINPQQVTRIELPGSCNNITGYADFNAEKFVGTWYEVARYPQPTQTGQCNQANYTLGANGVVSVRNSQVIDEDLKIILGKASTIPERPGVLAVTLETGNGLVTPDLYVLDTDHVSYALLYSCRNITGADGQPKREVGSWKLSKQQGGLTRQAETFVNETIRTTSGLNQNYYLSTSQNNAACFYYPEWTTLPDTIELHGPCNTSITGTTNFNATTFAGTWHEVARYPNPRQPGQCNRAEYEIVNNVLTIQNRQVWNQTLLTSSRSATEVAGQSGVFTVTTSNDTHTTVYVLDTDNTNYALLYTCENLPENRRRVDSWQMIKQSGTLTPEATSAISNRIAATQGLKNDYYRNTSQTNDDCFYYPPTQPGEKVVMPGQCVINGMSNINMTRFANGTWYHIRRYDQVGNRSCIATRLSLADDFLMNVYNVEVNNGTVNRTEGVAQLTEAAQGQFSLSWFGSEVNTTVIVMDTDYDNYTIAYTCQNAGTERQVGVWLLSRTRDWPAAGQTALQDLEARRQEVTQRDGYFKTIPHNDQCPEASSAFLFKSSIIVILVCTVLQFIW